MSRLVLFVAAIVAGGMLALGATAIVSSLLASSSNQPVNQTLTNYGTR